MLRILVIQYSGQDFDVLEGALQKEFRGFSLDCDLQNLSAKHQRDMYTGQRIGLL